jgi:hypothetical protein
MPYPCRTTKNWIDWDKVIKSIVPMSGDKNTVNAVVDRSEAQHKLDPVAKKLLIDYRDIIKTWKDANYDLEKIEWYDYYPGEHFDIEIQNTFAKIVNAVPKRVFISEVMPGRCVPYHWDVEDKEQEWIKEGKLVRYVCFIDKPKFGHVFLFKNVCFYNREQHEVHQWENYKDFHAGTNCGTDPYYLFHFLGLQK